MTERLTDEALSDDELDLLATAGLARPWVSQMARELLAYRRATPADDLRAALEGLLHAVCGENGFAAAVRSDSGYGYPWPALDIAEERARAALAKITQEGRK